MVETMNKVQQSSFSAFFAVFAPSTPHPTYRIRMSPAFNSNKTTLDHTHYKLCKASIFIYYFNDTCGSLASIFKSNNPLKFHSKSNISVNKVQKPK